jgi:Family of unknown function (DUF6370)
VLAGKTWQSSEFSTENIVSFESSWCKLRMYPWRTQLHPESPKRRCICTHLHHLGKEFSMKTWFVAVVAVALISPLLVGYSAAQQKDKEVTLKGKVTCAKCDLGVEKNCTTVIVVKEKDKDVVYYFDTKANKDYHAEICSDSKEGEVTGVVSDKDGKKTVTVSKVNYKK